MDQLDINSIMKEFKLFVDQQITIKTQQPKPIQSKKQIDSYYDSLQKRLKIKPVTHNQKFQNILAPMKKLKTFVSVKQFLKGLHHKELTAENIKTPLTTNTTNKLEYEQLRGGLYMQKVQNHLKKYNHKRKLDDQAQTLLKNLELVPTEKNQYRNWMQNILENINMKQQIFITAEQENEIKYFTKSKNEALIIENFKPNSEMKKIKKDQQKSSEEEEKFKTVSNYLTDRLKKILTDKFVNNATKQKRKNKTIVKPLSRQSQSQFRSSFNPSLMSPTTRRLVCRTTNTSKRVRTIDLSQINRARTSELKTRKPFQDIWKRKMNCKMNDLLMQVNNEFRKSQQNKKQIKTLYNKMQGQNNENVYL